MAQRGIREYDGKRIIAQNWKDYFGDAFEYDFKSVLVTPETDFEKLPEEHPWLKTTPLVAKPDMLFGKRGKLGLVLFKINKPGDVTYEDAVKWIKQKMQEEVEINGVKGHLTHFLIEPFVPHKPEEEYYVAFSMGDDYDTVYMSAFGGIDVEENWDKVSEVKIPPTASDEEIEKLIKQNVPKEIKDKEKYADFVIRAYKMFRDLHFVYFEINPLVLVGNKAYLLDFVGKVDDTAGFVVGKNGESLSFRLGLEEI